MEFGFRKRFIVAATIFGTLVVGGTELLSLAHAITRFASVSLAVVTAAVVIRFCRRPDTRLLRQRLRSLERLELATLIAIGFVIVVNLVLALFAAPSAFDALSYHVPRIHHWVQNHTLAHYPTWIDRQLWIGPGWEYFALHLELITGNDLLINCVEWASLIGCVIVSSELASQLGATRKGQIFAALTTATIPMA